MGSVHVCQLVPAVLLSRPVDPRVESACLPDIRTACIASPMNDAVLRDNITKPSLQTAFNRKHKLTKAIEFKRVFKKPFVSSDQCFKILARLNQEENSRLGMAVSRQVDKHAVGRNRIKRVIRESFRHRYNTQRVCLDIVVLPRRETATICNRRLFRSLQGHWSRLDNLLKDKN